jgi:hypothetical protein
MCPLLSSEYEYYLSNEMISLGIQNKIHSLKKQEITAPIIQLIPKF